jgi:hypothetical protein
MTIPTTKQLRDKWGDERWMDAVHIYIDWFWATPRPASTAACMELANKSRDAFEIHGANMVQGIKERQCCEEAK